MPEVLKTLKNGSSRGKHFNFFGEVGKTIILARRKHFVLVPHMIDVFFKSKTEENFTMESCS